MNDFESDQTFRVDQIDHVELFVPDRYEAARWYGRVLGLEIIRDFEKWADDLRGPLMISTVRGDTKLALFQGRPTDSSQPNGFHLVAFRVSSGSFLQFLDRLGQLELTDHNDRRVTPQLIVDHQMAYSVYFCDPWRNRLELTTYEYKQTRQSVAHWHNDSSS